MTSNRRKSIMVPCDFSSPLGLLSNLRQLPVTVLVIEERRCFRWLKPMKGSLRVGPLSFPLLLTIVFLGRESSLNKVKKEMKD